MNNSTFFHEKNETLFNDKINHSISNISNYKASFASISESKKMSLNNPTVNNNTINYLNSINNNNNKNSSNNLAYGNLIR